MENRNFRGIQFEDLRREIDDDYNEVHDELTECFYQKKPFREFGILDKSTFDKLHGLIFHQREIEFHQRNMQRPESERYPVDKYNHKFDKEGNVIAVRSEISSNIVSELEKEGFVLEVKKRGRNLDHTD